LYYGAANQCGIHWGNEPLGRTVHRIAPRNLRSHHMDNLTHTLFGLTLARTPLARAGRGTTAALVLASNAPDIDIVAVIRGNDSYLRWHRGPTHGPLGIIALGLLVAAIVRLGVPRLDRSADEEAVAAWPMLAVVSMI